MDLHLFARTEAGLEGTDESDRVPSSRAGPVCRNASHRDFVALGPCFLCCDVELGRAQRIAATHVLRQAGLLHATGGVEQ